jgi:hypothetical protein
MPGLEPGIHELAGGATEDVDGRDKPGHDGLLLRENYTECHAREAGIQYSSPRRRLLGCPGLRPAEGVLPVSQANLTLRLEGGSSRAMTQAVGCVPVTTRA